MSVPYQPSALRHSARQWGLEPPRPPRLAAANGSRVKRLRESKGVRNPHGAGKALRRREEESGEGKSLKHAPKALDICGEEVRYDILSTTILRVCGK